MNSYKTVEAKLWNAVSMLTSGVLTNMIYGLLSGSSYELNVDGKHYEITSTGMNIWHAFAIIIFTFLSLWALISVLIPFFLKIRKRFEYDKIERSTAKDLIRVLDETSESIKDLYLIFDSANGKNKDLLRLHSRELAKAILRLHRTFLPQNKRLRKIIEKYFRQYTHATIVTIDQKVSGYELAAAVALLKNMVSQLKLVADNNTLLEKDCTMMEDKLNDLDQLNPSLNELKPNNDT